MKSILLIIMTLFCSAISYSQGQYLENGVSGNGISGSFSSYKGLKNYGFNIGKSFSGVVDLGFSGGISYQNELNDGAYLFSPSITVHLFKSLPLSLAPTIGYVYSTVSHSESSLKGFSGGISLYGAVKKEKEIYIIPILSVSYTSLNSSPNNSSYQYQSNVETSSLSESFALSIVYKLDERKSLFIQPAITYSNNAETKQTDFIIGLGLGLVFISK